MSRQLERSERNALLETVLKLCGDLDALVDHVADPNCTEDNIMCVIGDIEEGADSLRYCLKNFGEE